MGIEPQRTGVMAHAPTAPDRAPAGRIVQLRSHDDLILAVRIFGTRTERLPLLCLPGLSRNSLDFIAVGQRFGAPGPEERQVIAVDYRGRGLSDADPNWRNYTPVTEAHDVLAVATALGIDRTAVLGTSRGGIIAMTLGSLRPGLLAGVILNDIGPVIEGTGLARIKAYLTAGRRVRNWTEAEAALRLTHAATFPSLSALDWQAWARAVYIERGSTGLEPNFDRSLVKTLDAINFTDSLPTTWPQFDSLGGRPVLAIRGEHSDLLAARTLKAMAERIRGLTTHIVSGQGHAPLLRDDTTLGEIGAFLARCDASAVSREAGA